MREVPTRVAADDTGFEDLKAATVLLELHHIAGLTIEDDDRPDREGRTESLDLQRAFVGAVANMAHSVHAAHLARWSKGRFGNNAVNIPLADQIARVEPDWIVAFLARLDASRRTRQRLEAL